jgi:hypothetical protein
MMIKKKDGSGVYLQDRPETQVFITENIFIRIDFIVIQKLN